MKTKRTDIPREVIEAGERDGHCMLTPEEMDQLRWEQTVGPNFPITAEGFDYIVLLLIVSLAAWWLRGAFRRLQKEIRIDTAFRAASRMWVIWSARCE